MFRQECTAKHLIKEEVQKALHSHHEKINWETQISGWSSEVYLKPDSLRYILSLVDTELDGGILCNITNKNT